MNSWAAGGPPRPWSWSQGLVAEGGCRQGKGKILHQLPGKKGNKSFKY